MLLSTLEEHWLPKGTKISKRHGEKDFVKIDFHIVGNEIKGRPKDGNYYTTFGYIVPV